MTAIRRSFLGWRRWWRSQAPHKLGVKEPVVKTALAGYEQRLRERTCIIQPPKKGQGKGDGSQGEES